MYSLFVRMKNDSPKGKWQITTSKSFLLFNPVLSVVNHTLRKLERIWRLIDVLSVNHTGTSSNL